MAKPRVAGLVRLRAANQPAHRMHVTTAYRSFLAACMKALDICMTLAKEEMEMCHRDMLSAQPPLFSAVLRGAKLFNGMHTV